MQVNYADYIVPVSVYANSMLPEQDAKIMEDSKLFGPYLSQVSLMNMIAALMQRRDPILQQPQYDAFVHALGMCRMGFVKEAQGLSTSASVGCARSCFDAQKPQDPSDIGLVFNFGTGGGKVTAFKLVNDQLQVVFDIKPRDGGPNPNRLAMGNYKPKNPKSEDQDLKDMDAFCDDIQRMIEQLGLTVQWTKVFVTGPIREFYYNCQDEEAKVSLDKAIFYYMRVPITSHLKLIHFEYDDGMFLPQEREAEYENIACEAMYAALAAADPELASCVVVPNTSCGIGRGSAQVFLGLMTSFGMNALEAKERSTDELLRAMLAHLATDKGKAACDAFVADVQRITTNGHIPVIPCKSGFAILMEDPKIGYGMMQRAFGATRQMRKRQASLQTLKQSSMWNALQKKIGELAEMTAELQRAMWHWEEAAANPNGPEGIVPNSISTVNFIF